MRCRPRYGFTLLELLAVMFIIALLAGMLLLALLIYPLAARYRLPLAAVLVTVGFIGSEAMVAEELTEVKVEEGVRPRAFNMVIPIAVMVLMMLNTTIMMTLKTTCTGTNTRMTEAQKWKSVGSWVSCSG